MSADPSEGSKSPVTPRTSGKMDPGISSVAEALQQVDRAIDGHFAQFNELPLSGSKYVSRIFRATPSAR
jgi:hypothetical protein